MIPFENNFEKQMYYKKLWYEIFKIIGKEDVISEHGNCLSVRNIMICLEKTQIDCYDYRGVDYKKLFLELKKNIEKYLFEDSAEEILDIINFIEEHHV